MDQWRTGVGHALQYAAQSPGERVPGSKAETVWDWKIESLAALLEGWRDFQLACWRDFHEPEYHLLGASVPWLNVFDRRMNA